MALRPSDEAETGQPAPTAVSPSGQPPSALQPPTERTTARVEWIDSLKSAAAHSQRNRLNVVAGSLAYRWFLSLFPALIAVLGVSALAHMSTATTARLIHGAATALPPGASDVVTSAIKDAQHRTSGATEAVIIAAVVALWSALSSTTVMQSALDMAFEIPKDRKFVANRLMGVVLLVGFVVLGGVASALIVFGPQIGHAIEGHISLAGHAFIVLWTIARWVAALACVMFLFAFLYWLGPNRERPRWRWLSPGALIGTVLWVIASVGFSYYTSKFGSYGKTYGALAGVAILIFWFYVTGIAMVFGAEVNAEFERRYETRSGEPTSDEAPD